MPTTDERLERIEALLAELSARMPLDVNRAYSDKEVRAFLDISRDTLWRIRKTGALLPVELVPGSVPRTTGRQIAEYLKAREQESNVLEFTGTGRKRKTA